MRFIAVFLLSTLLGCQHTKEVPLEVDDITGPFRKLSPEIQKAALENSWVYFTHAFNVLDFQKRVLEEFPSLALFGQKTALLGKTPLDLRPLRKSEVNPVSILLAIDLEMEILSRFHSNSQSAPRCLENFWSEWGLPLSRPQAFLPAQSNADAQRALTQVTNLDANKEIALNENSRRLALYLRQSLGLNADAKIKLISYEDPNRAQFTVGQSSSEATNTNGSDNVYEILSSPIDCKSFQEKKLLVPALGKMKCLQKQSATWITVAAKESTVLSDNWISEVRQRCLRWVRPISDQLHKESSENLKNSPIPKSWSLYPRLRNFVLKEADRYENAFRKSL